MATRQTRGRRGLGLICLLLLSVLTGACRDSAHQWSPAEQSVLRSLSIESLPPLPPDPSNAVADDASAAALGQALYFDPRLSANGQVSCASCHQPARYFTDGKTLAEGLGRTRRHAPSIIGAAYSPWFFWDGRSDSQWAQATGPLEAAVEHGGSRGQYAHVVFEHYRKDYESRFGPMPELDDLERFPERAGPVEDEAAQAAWQAMRWQDREAVSQVFANIGKSIAAYERLIQPGPARMDAYIAAVLAGDLKTARQTFSDDEAAGLRIFIDRGQCTNCHMGPRLTNDSFHNIGLPLRRSAVDAGGVTRELSIEEAFDQGRDAGVVEVLADEMNCLGPFSDAAPEDCVELRFAKVDGDEMVGAFKVPSLRNVAETAPYMHDGRFDSLTAVLAHYNAAPPALSGHSELVPLNLRAWEIAQLEAFLGTLTGPVAADAKWLVPPSPRAD